MAEVSTSEIPVSNLSTKSVTLTPSRATVTREIHTTIQPGQNELSVVGIDPRVDVDSIRIEGSGSATITDIQTEVIPRQERFEDIYSDLSDRDDDGDGDGDGNGEEEEKGSAADRTDVGTNDADRADLRALQTLRLEQASISKRLSEACNDKVMSSSVLEFLDGYGRNMRPENTNSSQVDHFLQLYTATRTSESIRNYEASVQSSELQQEQQRLTQKQTRLESKRKKAKEAGLKEVRRRREERQRKREQKKREWERQRRDRQQFWTGNMARVTVSLDSNSSFTPGSSRRSSITETAVVNRSEGTSNENAVDVTLFLSYVVSQANWTPRYELRINTPSSSARMAYRAEFQNTSAETWKDTRVTLSTSQASFSGLDERIPILQPWQIRLSAPVGNGDGNKDKPPSWDGALRNEGGTLFGPSFRTMERQQHLRQNLQVHGMQMPQQMPQMPRLSDSGDKKTPPTSELIGNMFAAPPQPSELGDKKTAPASGLFGSMSVAPPQPSELGDKKTPPTSGLFRSMSVAPLQPSVSEYMERRDDDEEEEQDDDADRQTLPASSLDHEDSLKQNYGLTTTYELRSRRTLIPSNVHRRHILADVDLKSVILSHIIVPKHRVAAFLRARVRNTSSMQILRGRVGMTVDGTFLGTSRMPNCAPNDIFSITMGVDPSILVNYAKPTMRQTTTGFFAKEHAAVFQRSCWVKNSKSVPIDLTVLEQMPVSEDEKLRIQLQEPEGLGGEGDSTKMVGMDAEKGDGTVSMGKNGEIRWAMRLQPGKDVRVVLKYEAKAPGGSAIIGNY